MGRNESCEHGKYCFVCSCLIVESVEKLSIKLSEWGDFPTIKVNEEWNSIFGGAAMDEGYSVNQAKDGRYIIAGYTGSYGAGSADFWIIKTDAYGNEQWNVTFGGTGLEKCYSAQQTSDGGYIAAGYTNSFGAGYTDCGWWHMMSRSPTW